MRKIYALFIVFASSFLQLNPALGLPVINPGEPQRLYALDVIAQPDVRRDLVPDGIEEFLIRVNPAAVLANPPVLIIDLPDSSPLVATRTQFVAYRPDWQSWFGTLRHTGASGRGTGFIHVGYHGDRVTAVIDFEGERFRIAGDSKEGHRLVRLSGELSPPPCGLDGTTDFPAETAFFAEERLDDSVLGTQTAAATAATIARIDVLAVYPKAFFTLSASVESSVFTFIQDSISLANNAFANSSVAAFYNLVGVVPVLDTPQPSTGVSSSLNWLNNQSAEITALRSAFGADVVTVYIPFEWSSPNVCGIANLPKPSAPIGQKAYTANRNGCGLNDFTLAHEIGHNYGMRHDDDTNADALYSFGRGHLLTVSGQQKATVMACTCGAPPSPKPLCGSVGANSVCNRIPYFSDPARSYMSIPTGTVDRNNAEVGRLQVVTYAGFQSESQNASPTASFTFSRCGNIIFFNAGSSTDDAPLPVDVANYRWDFGDGTTGTGKTPAHRYIDGAYRVHLVVKDSHGKTDVVWGVVTPQGICPNPL